MKASRPFARRPVASGAAARRRAGPHRRGGEFLWRPRPADRRRACVEVTSILTNPDQDPHLFEASPETARGDRRRRHRHRQRRRLRPLDAEAARRVEVGDRAAGDRRRRACRRQARRQSASVVRAGEHRGGGRRARGGACRRRSRGRRQLSPQRGRRFRASMKHVEEKLARHAQALHGRPGRRVGAGVRLCRARPSVSTCASRSSRWR